MGAGGAIGIPWYYFNKLAWNTGCIFIVSGSYNLYDSTPTYRNTLNGPTNLGANFLQSWEANEIFLVSNITIVLGYILDSLRCLSAYYFMIAYDYKS